jgi:hypothetical protein
MSFSFQWPQFSDQFHADTISMLEAALNKGNKPPVIAGKIEVVELHMGSEASTTLPVHALSQGSDARHHASSPASRARDT